MYSKSSVIARHRLTERYVQRVSKVLGHRLPLLYRLLPFALYIVLMAAEPWLASQLSGSIDTRWLYGFRSLLSATLILWFWRHFSELEMGLSDVTFREVGLSLGVGLAVLFIWLLLDNGIFVMGTRGTGFVPLRADGGMEWPLVMMRLLGSALVVPVMEELFWRSFLMRWLNAPEFWKLIPASVGLRALVLSSVVFGFEHSQWAAGILAGLAYGWLYMWRGRLWLPILAHMVTNAGLGFWVLATGAWYFW